MVGKLMFLWQNVLIVVLVQMGFFVLVVFVYIGLVDWLFFCVGVVDDLVWGWLIFMVEMVEMVVILNQVGDCFFVIFDEIG